MPSELPEPWEKGSFDIFGITEQWSTPEAIERAERHLGHGWDMPGDEDDHVVPLTCAAPSTGPKVASSEPASGSMFDESDGVDDPTRALGGGLSRAGPWSPAEKRRSPQNVGPTDPAFPDPHVLR